jgi:hypothetical protein
MKSGKAKQNSKEEIRKAEKGKKNSKSTLPLKSTLHNNVNTSPPS